MKDSNLRTSYEVTRFRGVRFQPLSQLSAKSLCAFPDKQLYSSPNSFKGVCRDPETYLLKSSEYYKVMFRDLGWKMGYYLYAIRSGTAQYVGATKNLNERLSRHNSGQNRSTKHLKNWILVHFEEFGTLTEARKREARIKKQKQKFC